MTLTEAMKNLKAIKNEIGLLEWLVIATIAVMIGILIELWRMPGG
jgi:hypothetical protein